MSKDNNHYDVVPSPPRVPLRYGASREEKTALADYHRMSMAIGVEAALVPAAVWVMGELSRLIAEAAYSATKAADALDQKAKSTLPRKYDERFSLFLDRALVQTFHGLLAFQAVGYENILLLLSHMPQFQALPPEQKGFIRRKIKEIFG